MDRQARYERYWAEVGDPEKRRKVERRYKDRKRVARLPEAEWRDTQKGVGTGESEREKVEPGGLGRSGGKG